MGVVYEYPEHVRLSAVKERSQACGEFLDWLLGERGYVLAEEHAHTNDCRGEDGLSRVCGVRAGELVPGSMVNTKKLLVDFFKIDIAKLEEEKKKMLANLAKLEEKNKKMLADRAVYDRSKRTRT